MAFFKKMFASGESDTVSHKRFNSIISMTMLVGLGFLSAFNHPVQECFVYLFGSIALGESGLTVIEKIKGATFGGRGENGEG